MRRTGSRVAPASARSESQATEGVLIIRSARETVLRNYLARNPDVPVTILGHASASQDSEPRLLQAPPGPLRWRRFNISLRNALRTRRWSEIVVLHNLGDESYTGVYAIAARVGATAPFRIFQANGVEHVYRSWLHFAATRVPLVAVASLALAILVVALVPFRLCRALGWRRA